MSDPASWFLVEPGMPVHGSDGAEVGTVTEVVGDEDKDIFNGLMVRARLLGSSRYVPSEQVGEIVDGRVTLKLTKDEFDALGEFEEPPESAEIEPEAAGLLTRAEADVEAPTHARPEQIPLVRRILLWFGLKKD